MNTVLLRSKLQEALNIVNLMEIFQENADELHAETKRDYRPAERQRIQKDYEYYAAKLDKARKQQIALIKDLQEIVKHETIRVEAKEGFPKSNAKAIGDIFITPKN